jgi:2-isopropylmalate synthase
MVDLFGSPQKAKISNLVLYDTTLRDGAQTRGLSMSLADKLSISKKLSSFGVHYIEGGWPSSNQRDMEYFEKVKGLSLSAKTAAFGMTAKDPAKDPQVAGLLKAGADVVTVFGKGWELHVKDVLKISNDENLRMISSTVEYLKAHGLTVFFDAEHFFDGYKANPSYALAVMEAASASGADALVMCDSNGGALPWEVAAAVTAVREKLKIKELGIHAHNDTGMAVMNALAAVSCGARQVQGTVNGLGERCGNTDWCEFLPLLGIKLGVKLPVDMKGLYALSRYVERMTGFSLAANKPFIGENAFSHKGGVHIDAMLKNPRAYEHMSPDEVGNATRFSLSEQVGRSGVTEAAGRFGYHIAKGSPEATRLTDMVKENQATTEAEFFLMLEDAAGGKRHPFELLSYETEVSSDGRAKTEVKMKVGGEVLHEISEGVGPVHAMDLAIRKALGKKFSVEGLRLTNYRVRIVNQEKATAASVEVFIEFRTDSETWSASGVSDDIIKASEEALLKGYRYYLLKCGACR